MEIGSQSFRELLDRHTNIELILSTGPLLFDSIKMNGTRIIQIVAARSERIWQARVWIDASSDMAI